MGENHVRKKNDKISLCCSCTYERREVNVTMSMHGVWHDYVD